MGMNKQRRIGCFLLAGATLLSAATAWAGSFTAITKPSDDVTLTFSRPGRIAKVHVKEGDAVKVEQPLVDQDRREEEVAMAMAKAEADDKTELEAQVAILEQKKIDLTRVEWAFKQGAKSQFELDEARIQVVIETARLKIAEFKKEQNRLKYEQAKVVVDKTTLRSPVTGIVKEILLKTGESVEQQSKVIRVVNLNPLWIDVPAKFAEGRLLQKGDKVLVRFQGQAQPEEALVIFVDPGADAASDTLKITVELPNPTNRRAGDQVQVEFSVNGK